MDSSSDESINESVYSDEDFEQDSMDELADKSIVSVKSDKSTKSTKSVKSTKSTKSARSTKSLKSTTSEKSKPEEKKEEPVTVEIAAPVESAPVQPLQAAQVAPLTLAPEPFISEPAKPPLVQSTAKSFEIQPSEATVTLGKIMEARTETTEPSSVSEAGNNNEKTIDINTTISERMKNQAKTMGTSKNRPTSAPVGSRLQKMMASRKSAKAKLPENYNGLGSTAMLNELERFKTNALNLELQEMLS